MNIKLLLLFSSSLLALASCSGSAEPDGGTGSDQPYYLDVMQFNIRYVNSDDTGDTHWTVRKNAIKTMLKELQPDVISINEARTTQRDDLKSMLPEYGFLEVPNTGTSSGGNVNIMYLKEKFQLLASKSFYLSATPNVPSFTWDSTQKQYHACIWAQLKDNETGKVFYFFATHYNTGSTDVDIAAKTNSTNLILSKIDEITGGDSKAIVFVAGDMNASLESNDSRCVSLKPYLDNGFKNARTSALSTDDIISYNGFSDTERTQKSNIDFIFYKNVTGMAFKTVNEPYNGIKYISDHYPVTLKAMTF
ncbi:MAG: endonuclease/exonuclease/phosphatase family protein [Candidatus Cryptobacteroides sp.]